LLALYKETNMAALDAQAFQRLQRELHEPDRHVLSEALGALCRSGDPAALEAVIDVLEHEDRYPAAAAVLARQRLVSSAEETLGALLAHLGRSPATWGGESCACLLGEIAALRQRQDPRIQTALVRALETVLGQGLAGVGGIVMGLEYLSRLGPLPESSPALRKLLLRAQREPDCPATIAAGVVRVLYVNEGDALLAELGVLAQALPGEHNLRAAIDHLLTARVAGQPHHAHDPLPWEQEATSRPSEPPRPTCD
jgi:hypothetical protein